MAIKTKHKQTEFGIGDRVKVSQKIIEGEKERLQVFDGIVISIKGEGKNKSFTVRRIGVQQVGIERIFPLYAPSIEKIEVVRSGVEGVKKSKLYYIREKHKKEIEKIYSRAGKKNRVEVKKIKTKTRKTSERKKKTAHASKK